LIRRVHGLALVAALCSLPGTASQAQPPTPLATFTRRLEQLGSGTRSLAADFTQRKQLRLFRSEVTSHGRLRYQRPDRLRWETLPPDASVLVVEGTRAQLRLPGEKPRLMDLKRDRAMATLIEQLLVWLGARPASRLAEWYRLRLEPVEKGEQVLHLEPRLESVRKRIQSVAVRFDAQMQLRQIRIQHVGGDRTSIALDNVQRNVKLSPSLFH